MPVSSGVPEYPSLRTSVSRYRSPRLAKSVGQIANSFLPFFGLCALMYASLDLSYALTLALAIPAAGFVVRIFIIQHDCGHGAFFRSRCANTIVGRLCSLVTLAPYAHWRRQHAGHHANWNNLDRRLSGLDLYSSCLTTDEYRNLNAERRALYRVSRHPLVALVILPPLVFLLLYRVPFDTPRSWKKERRAVHLTNLALLGLSLALGFTLGFRQMLMVQLPICVIAATFGVFLFSLQHRFEHTLWARREEWNFTAASLRGSSYLKLPKILQWFTGNIGFHHVHHLHPRIPNYRLQACHDANPLLQAAPVLTLRSGLGSVRFALWDEQQGRMVPFRPLR
jgi:omega-6 fatty acid desaturase (delta-12 desaturase)